MAGIWFFTDKEDCAWKLFQFCQLDKLIVDLREFYQMIRTIYVQTMYDSSKSLNNLL